MEEHSEAQMAQAEGEFIKTPSEINRLLSRVKEKLSPVTLRFPGMQRAMTSYILDIDPKLRFILLDEALPKADNRILQEGRPLTLETYHDGCRIRAKDLRIKPVRDNGSLSYRVQFPPEIHYLQRRASYRAQVRRSLEIPARMLDTNRQVVNGLLRDMSAEGCQVQVIGDYVDVLKPHNKPIPLKLYFPNGTSLVLKADLRFVGYDERGDFTKCGCQFTHLDPHKEREISRVVTDLQRDYINFTKHGGDPEGIPLLFLPPEVDEDIAALDGKGPPPRHADHAAREGRRAREARRQKRQSEPVQIDIRRTLLSSVAAVKSLIGSARLQQDLPVDELQGAANQLAQALLQDREALLVYTHIRNTTDFIFEHPVSLAVLFADQARHQDKGLEQRDIAELVFAGLCHDVPRALLPEGEKETGVEVSPDKQGALKKTINEVCHTLNANDSVPRETAMLVAQAWERLDGSGLPEGLKGDRLHPLGKLVAALDVIDTAAHQYRNDVFYHPAIAYKRALNQPERLDNALVKRTIMVQGLYPLGAPVRLDNGYIGLVMRHDAQRKPRVVRLVYHLTDETQVLPRDIDLEEAGVTVQGPGDSVRFGLSTTLLQSPLKLS